MANKFVTAIFGDYSKKEVKRVKKTADKVLALEDKYAAMSDKELTSQTDILKGRLANGETLDDILPDAFAVCREGAWRVLGMKHFPVQIIGGIVLHQGRIAEMKTGEGKTLVATLPAYLNALTGEGVHIVTVNDYLAKRDSEWMGKLYRFLGLMRKNEGDFVEKTFTSLFDMNFVRVNCGDVFLEKLKGVVDPEQKRKIIGTEFFNVFWNEIRKQDELGYFAQGTIYPDCIESGKGDADVIKTHHNRVNTPDDVEFLGIIEPLADLFKDEVRAVGEKLGIPKQLVWRQPFPGPGLGVRIIGEITADKIKVLQDADWVLRDEMAKNGYEKNLAQFFCVLPCVKTVGVMGDHRTYDHLVAIRAVTTDDFMTADWAKIPYDILAKVSNRITNEVEHINRVVYDITSKPPGTVEWE